MNVPEDYEAIKELILLTLEPWAAERREMKAWVAQMDARQRDNQWLIWIIEKMSYAYE